VLYILMFILTYSIIDVLWMSAWYI